MKNILVPVDFSEITPGLLDQASALAKPLGARVSLLHVVTPPVIMTAYGLGNAEISDQIQAENDRSAKNLQKFAAQLQQQGIEVSQQVRQGGTVESILQAAHEQPADFIVLGSHGRGAVYDILVGSTARGVLRQATCPVLVVPHAKRAASSSV